MRTAAAVEPGFGQAARATAAGSRSFYFASRFFPRELAQAAHAIYWFCRHTDDLVDEAPSVEVGRRQLEEWARAVEAMLGGAPPAHPVLAAFAHAVRLHSIPAELPLELIEGMRMDLERVRYRDFDHLRVFCYRVASVVGLMMARVIGHKPGAEPYAVDLGIALQLTNILRDIGEDLGRGRIYLPQEELEAFGYGEAGLTARRRDERFRKLMDFQVRRAHSFYNRALPGIDLLNPQGRIAVRVSAGVYRGILDQIERGGYDVFERRAVVPALTKYRLAATALWEPVWRTFR